MADIKTKKKQEISIKKLDRLTVVGQNLKSNMINVKEKTKENYEKNEDTAKEYAENKVKNAMKDVGYYAPRLNRKGKQNFEKTIQNIEKGKIQIKKAQKGIKNVKAKGKVAVEETKRNIKKVQNTVKSAKKTVKTAEETTKQAVKITKQVTKNSVRLAQRTAQMTRQAVRTTIKATKIAIKATIATIKAIIAGTKALIAFLMAGGWILALIIIIICLIGFICSSVYGVFFSNESEVGDITMSSVVRKVNNDFTKKITEIQNNTEHNDYEINSNRATWKDMLSIYAVLVTGGNEQSDVITLNDEKIAVLKQVFWNMNIITCRTEDIEKDIEIFDDDGNSKIEKVTRKVLYIDITSKSLQDMIELYNLNQSQIEQLAELQKDEYNEMWGYLFYGTGTGSTDIVEVALSQVGNKGRSALLVLVWLFFKGRMVCLLCQLVC